MAKLSEFKAKFSKQITLRNELVPFGNTSKNITSNEIVVKDEERAENYKKVKKIIDNYHRKFISDCLSQANLNWQSLAVLLNQHNTEENQVNIEKEQTILRKQITHLFKNNKDVWGKLFNKKLISDLLPKFATDEESLHLINSFKKFTTYFSGFNKNRQNVYSDEAKSTSIAFRIVHDNFPKFIANINVYNVLKTECADILKIAEKEFIKNKILENEHLDDVFSVNYFNKILTQEGIDKFNCIVGGVSAEVGQQKTQGLNEYINLATQTNKELAALLKQKHSIKLTVLFKQILSDRDSKFFIDSFSQDTEVIEAVQNFIDTQIIKARTPERLMNLIDNIEAYNHDNLWIQGKNINELSKTLWSGKNWDTLRNAIETENENNKEFAKAVKKAKNDIDKAISTKMFTLHELDTYCKTHEKQDLLNSIKTTIRNLVSELDNTELPPHLKSADEKAKVKKHLDTYLALYRFCHLFSFDSSERGDFSFYGEFNEILNALSPISYLYNKVRNFATKKPYSLEKFKINFESPILAAGWSETTEQAYLTCLFLKNKQYYLGVLNKKIDFSQGETNNKDNSFKKIRYFLFKDLSKMLPKCSTAKDEVKLHFSTNDSDYILKKKFIEPLVITKEIFSLANVKDTEIKKFQKEYQKINETEYRKALKLWITFAIDFLKKYKTTANFDYSTLKSPSEYNDLSEFYKDANNVNYKIDFCYIDEKFINEQIDNGALYLFQIKNKDFAPGAKGTKNLHTMYFEGIFNPENIKRGIIQLNGGAELFFRKKSLEKTPIHKATSKLVNKNLLKPDNTKERIPDNIYLDLCKYLNNGFPKNEAPVTIVDYYNSHKDEIIVKEAKDDIVKDKRFTVDKFFFHCPITINYKEADTPTKFNDKVLDFLRNNPDINIIGIDRGERNLLSVSIINQKGEMLKSFSFNKIESNNNGIVQKDDYQQKLALREKQRKDEKKSWDSISKIATLKEGYLALVIHELTKLMIEYNAIIVLENLNAGFKRIRNGIAERSVYQKFEKMLIDKLNYLVFKKNGITEPGGLLNGYQLTNKLTTFNEIGQQTGFIFYVPAAYTSTIDPTTGFANVLNLNQAKTAEDKKMFFSKFTSIKYIPQENIFMFTLDFSKSTLKCMCEFEKNTWDIYSYGKRIISVRKDKAWEQNLNYVPTEKLKELFEDERFQIDYLSGNDILPTILNQESCNDYFWTELFKIFKNILQMRNSVINSTEEDDDILLSPVKNEHNEFFDSSKKKDNLPKDADENGAFHIALKGLMILQKNNKAKLEKEKKEIKTISNKDWFKFVQNKKERFKIQ